MKYEFTLIGSGARDSLFAAAFSKQGTNSGKCLINCPEGTQMLCNEYKCRPLSISQVLLTDPTGFSSMSGLRGLLLSILSASEVHAGEGGFSVPVVADWGATPVCAKPMSSTKVAIDQQPLSKFNTEQKDESCHWFGVAGQLESAAEGMATFSRVPLGLLCELDTIRGRFLPKKAMELGVPSGPLFAKLTQGQTVEGTNGPVTLSMCSDKATEAGRVLLIIPEASTPLDVLAHAAETAFIVDGNGATQPLDASDVGLVIAALPSEGLNCVLAPILTRLSAAGSRPLVVLCSSGIVDETYWRRDCRDQVLYRSCLYESLANNHFDGLPFVLNTNIAGAPRSYADAVSEWLDSDSVQAMHGAGMKFILGYGGLTLYFGAGSTQWNVDQQTQMYSSPLPSQKEIEAFEARHSITMRPPEWTIGPTLLERFRQSTDQAGFILLGTGSAVPSKYRNVSSGVLLSRRRDGTIRGTWVDTGESSARAACQLFTPAELRELFISHDEDPAILITHDHGDHYYGIWGVLQLISQLAPHSLSVRLIASYKAAFYACLCAQNGRGSRASPLNLIVISPVQFSPLDRAQLEEGQSVASSLTVDAYVRSRQNELAAAEKALKFSLAGSPRLPSQCGYGMDSEVDRAMIAQRLLCIPGVLRRRINSVGQSALSNIIIREMDTNDNIYDGVTLRACPAIHGPNCAAFSYNFTIQTDDSTIQIAVSGDTRPNPYLVDMARGADILIHECTHEDELIADSIEKWHSTRTEALTVSKLSCSPFTVLTHFSQRYSKVSRNQLSDGQTGRRVPFASSVDSCLISCGNFEMAESSSNIISALAFED